MSLNDCLAGVICAAGHREIDGIPKVLQRIKGRTLVEWVVRAQKAAGLWPIVVVVNTDSGARVRSALESARINDCCIAFQPYRTGPAEAVKCALPVLEQAGSADMVVAFADNPGWTDRSMAELKDLHRKTARTAEVLTMASVPLNGNHPKELERYCRVIRHDGRIVRVVEPKDATPDEMRLSREVDPSLMALRVKWFAERVYLLPEHEKHDGYPPERYLYHLVKMASREGKKVNEFIIQNPLEALGVNTAEELAVMRRFME